MNSLVKISGKANAESLHKTPGTEVESVYFSSVVINEYLSHGINSSGRSWKHVRTDNSIGSIDVTDGTGEIKVLPDGATFDLKKVVNQLEVTPELLADNPSIQLDPDSLKKARHRIDVFAVLPGD